MNVWTAKLSVFYLTITFNCSGKTAKAILILYYKMLNICKNHMAFIQRIHPELTVCYSTNSVFFLKE